MRDLPFRAWEMNAAWLELVLCAYDLLARTKRLLLSGTPLAAWLAGEAVELSLRDGLLESRRGRSSTAVRPPRPW